MLISGCQQECFFLKSFPTKMLFQDDPHPCCLSLPSTVIVYLLTDLAPSVCFCRSRCCGSWAKAKNPWWVSSASQGPWLHTFQLLWPCKPAYSLWPRIRMWTLEELFFKRKAIAIILTNTEIWTLYLATSSFKEWDGTTIIKAIKAACVLKLTKG